VHATVAGAVIVPPLGDNVVVVALFVEKFMEPPVVLVKPITAVPVE
jgi:hypothetical protein